jgi:indole-3-acetate monooxygenase
LRPSGIAHAAAGGYRVSGRWAFASGIDHCAWWNGGCVVYEDGAPRPTETGTPQTVLVFFPATGGERIDTWDTGGLRGTGSHDYAVRDLFVPAERAFAFDASPLVPGLLYRLPCQALLDNAMAAIPLGIARTAIDTLIELAATKRPGRSDQPLAERLTVQAEVGRAEALYRSGRAFLYDSVAESWAAVQAGRKIEVTQLAMLRLARTHAVQAAVQAIDLMYTAAGGSAVYTHNLLERCFRDAHTVTQHLSMNPANYQVSGRVFLGLGSDRPLHRLQRPLRHPDQPPAYSPKNTRAVPAPIRPMLNNLPACPIRFRVRVSPIRAKPASVMMFMPNKMFLVSIAPPGPAECGSCISRSASCGQ